MISSLLTGLLFSVLISYTAYKKGSLSFSGAFAAVAVGTIIYGFGSVYWFGLLLSFFISSSFLSHYRKDRKAVVEDRFAKTGKRDYGQVLANGGAGIVLVLLSHVVDEPMMCRLFYLGAIASVNADTWATELGVLSKKKPIHVLSWKRVEKGISGGISLLGLLGTGLGGLFIGCCAALFLYAEGFGFLFAPIAAGTAAGIAGSLADSLLGATLQAMYKCPVCKKEMERREHCGGTTEKLRGASWCTNDAVNFISSMTGGGIALLFLPWL